MKSGWMWLTFLAVVPLGALAEDLGPQARSEFDRCMKETRQDRERCEFGGCGNIVGACYDRQIRVFDSATGPLMEKLSAGRCGSAAATAAGEIDALNSKLKSLAPFDGTWNGYEVQVEVASLKNEVMSAMTKECASSR